MNVEIFTGKQGYIQTAPSFEWQNLEGDWIVVFV